MGTKLEGQFKVLTTEELSSPSVFPWRHYCSSVHFLNSLIKSDWKWDGGSCGEHRHNSRSFLQIFLGACLPPRDNPFSPKPKALGIIQETDRGCRVVGHTQQEYAQTKSVYQRELPQRSHFVTFAEEPVVNPERMPMTDQSISHPVRLLDYLQKHG